MKTAEDQLDDQLEAFLGKFIEGYLYHDLINMAQVWPKIDEHHGAAGYPMIMTTLSGMELMGGILHTDAFEDTPQAGAKYFAYYWDEYMSPINSAYVGKAKLFRELLRHGLAHNYLTKSGIGITKGDPSSHMHLDNTSLIVDCLCLFADFWKSYIESARVNLDRNAKIRGYAKRNVDLILKSGAKKASNHFSGSGEKSSSSVQTSTSSSSTTSETTSTYITPSGIQLE